MRVNGETVTAPQSAVTVARHDPLGPLARAAPWKSVFRSSNPTASHRQPTPPVGAIPPAAIPTPPSPARLDRLREALRCPHPAMRDRRTEQRYCHSIECFIFSHHVCLPADMTGSEVNDSLTHLALKEKVGAPTRSQALGALLFLCRQVLNRESATSGKSSQPEDHAGYR